MDPISQTLEEGESNSGEQEIAVPPPPPFATISTISVCLKIPSQIYSLLTHAPSSSLPSSVTLHHPLKPARYSHSSNPILREIERRRLSLPPPPNGGGLAARRASLVWFRNDLRIDDNECLTSAHNDSTSVLHVYCFDPRDYGKSSSGFDKTGPFRASFLLHSLADLRANLQSRGSDLVLRIGTPESVLPLLARQVGATAVYAHREVSSHEILAEDNTEAALNDLGVHLNYTWGSTLYHPDDLPFPLEDMPTAYAPFKDTLKGLSVRNTIAGLDRLKPRPSLGDVEPGDIPTLLDLGLEREGADSSIGCSMVGGESEAVRKIQTFAVECRESVCGANLSSKISPWLAMGCISPRTVLEEIKKTASTCITAAFNKSNDSDGSSGDGTNWLMYELMWRDFFRFITKKYSSARKVDLAPVTA